jgi:hypothetical protein
MVWYEAYTKYAPQEVRDNDQLYASFKFLHKRYKEELEKEEKEQKEKKQKISNIEPSQA